jgi:hypothetical protein
MKDLLKTGIYIAVTPALSLAQPPIEKILRSAASSRGDAVPEYEVLPRFSYTGPGFAGVASTERALRREPTRVIRRERELLAVGDAVWDDTVA